MDTIIIGAGVVGFHITQLLSAENHNVTVIDKEQEALDVVEEMMDVQTLLGHGASTVTLVEAEVDEADLVVAVTPSDEINILACLIAKQLGAKRTLARLENPAYHDVSDRFFYQNLLGIDLVINPKNLAAIEISKRVRTPGATAVENFAGGRVTMKKIEVNETFKYLNKELRFFKLPKKCIIAMIVRGEEVIIPDGSTQLLPGDHVFVIGKKSDMNKIEAFFGNPIMGVKNVAIIGGGDIGVTVARNMENSSINVKLFESKRAQCEKLSRELKNTMIIHGNGTDLALLKEERVFAMDAFIAVSGEDETNLLAGLLAKELGVPKSLVLVHKADYMPVYERLGIDAAISPRLLTANYILKYVRSGEVAAISLIEGDKAEILEMKAIAGCPLIGTRLIDAPGKGFPRGGAIIGTIVRGGSVVLPHGETTIEEGDTVIVFALDAVIKEVERVFKARN